MASASGVSVGRPAAVDWAELPAWLAWFSLAYLVTNVFMGWAIWQISPHPLATALALSTVLMVLTAAVVAALERARSHIDVTSRSAAAFEA